MSLVSLGVTIAFFLLFAFVLYRSSKKGIEKNIYSLVTNVVTIVESFIGTRLLFRIFDSRFVALGKEIPKIFSRFDEKEWVHTTYLYEFTTFVVSIVVGIFLFYGIYLLLRLVNSILKKIIFKKRKGISFRAYKPEKKEYYGIFLGGVSFLLTTFILLYPIGAFLKIITTSVTNTQYTLSREVNLVKDNVVLKLVQNNVSVAMFDTVTRSNQTKNMKNSKELQGILEITLTTLHIANQEDIHENLSRLTNELSSTYLVPSFASEVCASFATAAKNGKPFLGQTISIPDNKSKELSLAILDIVSKWERENFIEDINTLFTLYDLLQKENISLEDYDSLLNALAKEEFDESLFLTLFHNDDFKSLIDVFMNFGMSTVLESMKLSTTENYTITLSLEKMSDAEIKEEARIFSITMKQLLKLKNLQANGFTKDDFDEMLDDLKEIQNSKILSDTLYYLVYQVLLQKIS